MNTIRGGLERGLYQHVPDGEVYIIESYPDGTVVGVCGPLVYAEVKAGDLWNYDCSPDGADWAQAETEAENGPRFIWKDIAEFEAARAT